MISHIATRIMGIEPDAPGRAVLTLGRLPPEVAWAQLDHVPVGANGILVFDETRAALDPYAADQKHWESLWFRP